MYYGSDMPNMPNNERRTVQNAMRVTSPKGQRLHDARRDDGTRVVASGGGRRGHEARGLDSTAVQGSRGKVSAQKAVEVATVLSDEDAAVLANYSRGYDRGVRDGGTLAIAHARTTFEHVLQVIGDNAVKLQRAIELADRMLDERGAK